MASGRISGVPRSLLLVHIGEGLASVVDNLVGTLQQVVDLIVDFELAVVLVHVADLSQLVGLPLYFPRSTRGLGCSRSVIRSVTRKTALTLNRYCLFIGRLRVSISGRYV